MRPVLRFIHLLNYLSVLSEYSLLDLYSQVLVLTSFLGTRKKCLNGDSYAL